MIELALTIVLIFILLPTVIFTVRLAWFLIGLMLSGIVAGIKDIANIPRDIIVDLYQWATSKPAIKDRKKLGYS